MIEHLRTAAAAAAESAARARRHCIWAEPEIANGNAIEIPII